MPLYNNPQVRVAWLDDKDKLNEMKVVSAECDIQGILRVQVRPADQWVLQEQSRSLNAWMTIHGVDLDGSLPPMQAVIKLHKDHVADKRVLADRLYLLEGKWFVRIYYWLRGITPNTSGKRSAGNSYLNSR